MLISKRIYQSLLYPAVEALRRTDARAAFHELGRLQWAGAHAVHESQLVNLERLLVHCFKHVPFYKNWLAARGSTPGRDRPVDCLRALPVVGKGQIRSNPGTFLADNAREFGPRLCCTGGTTGGMLHFQVSRAAHSNSIAYNLLQWYDAGYSLGERMIYLGGASLTPSLSDFRSWAYLRLQNIVALSSFGIDSASMRRYVATIRRSGARFLRGYAGSIALLARFVLDESIKDLQFEAVVTTAETLYPHHREAIEKAFSCRVFNEYGARDGSMLAFECSKHEGLHVGSPSCFVEILDDEGEPVAAGQCGNLALTSLDNYAFPFVRYQVGDRGAWAVTPCSCGRGFPVLEYVEGRSGDFVRTPDGKSIHSEFFSHLFWQFSEVACFQVRQENRFELEILFVADGGQLKADHARLAMDKVAHVCGPEMKVAFRSVQDIPVGRSGKWRYVVSSVAS